jgi:hypothetical protein
LPVLVIPPRAFLVPLECSDGIKPTNAMRRGAVAKRLGSPSSAAMVSAQVYGPAKLCREANGHESILPVSRAVHPKELDVSALKDYRSSCLTEPVEAV